MRVALFLASCSFVLASSTIARAADPAAAQAMFEHGKQLSGQNRLDDACRAFAESQRLDPATGTLLNLGDCYEKRDRRAHV